jgi:two-component system, OmpR family, sensor kinase
MPLRSKLILWYSGLLTIIIVLFGAALFAVLRLSLIGTIDATLSETVNQVIQNSRVGLIGRFSAPSEVVMLLPELDLFRASGVFVQVWELNEERNLTGESSNLEAYAQPLDPNILLDLPPAQEGEALNIYSNATINGASYRVLTRPHLLWDRQFAVQTAASLEAVNNASNTMILILVGSMAFALVGSMAMGMGLSHRALKPIDDVTRAAAHITQADDLKTRLTWQGPNDEIGRLNEVFNQMMDRLEGLFNVQQRFVADVSHELRTPLTTIRGNLDLIKRYGADKESLDAIESEVGRMSRLVGDLLLLARADFGGTKLELAEMDLDTLVSEVYREARILAKDRNLNVSIHDFEPVRIKGDSDRLKQLLLNLVTNAVKFTPEEGSIIINLRRTFDDALVEVIDTGIGIPADDLPHIFDRFYQVDPARARHTSEGSGLGLSIAKWIADAHGGRIEVISDFGKGTTFTIYIPHIEEKPVSPHSEVTRARTGIMRRPTIPTTPKLK